MDQKLFDKIEALAKSYEGEKNLGMLIEISIEYSKEYSTIFGNKSDKKDKNLVNIKYQSKKVDGSLHFFDVKTFEFEDPRYCYIYLKKQLEFELESWKMKKQLDETLGDIDELGLLELELKDAIELEDYIEATRIREQIKKLKNND